jgi:hypothetical protein
MFGMLAPQGLMATKSCEMKAILIYQHKLPKNHVLGIDGADQIQLFYSVLSKKKYCLFVKDSKRINQSSSTFQTNKIAYLSNQGGHPTHS